MPLGPWRYEIFATGGVNGEGSADEESRIWEGLAYTSRLGGVASRAPHLELVICSFFRQVSGAWISEPGDRVLLRGSQYYPSLPAPSPSPTQSPKLPSSQFPPPPLFPRRNCSWKPIVQVRHGLSDGLGRRRAAYIAFSTGHSF